MAELVPAPFSDLVTRLFREPLAQDALFELPRRNWYLPDADAPDLSVAFHDKRAGNPAGPAAGPHTQMAQNLLLSYVAGGRILELKTVQVKDELEIGRPCIDMTNVGFNIEWSQELRVEQSLREYVAGMMLIEMFRHNADYTHAALAGPAGEVIYDISVGYDLAGIKSEKVCGFLDRMRDASGEIDALRREIPDEYKAARELGFPSCISDSITLSTFHGCPAGEIEAICQFLIGEKSFDVIVKMNPPTLGRERLEHLLHDVLGYSDLCVNPNAYGAAIRFDESVELCERLTRFAKHRGRRVGFKFSNTLEVVNRRDFFSPDNEIMYLSGQPLHVITLALTDEFRRAVGPDVPISFSAGIDKRNFPLAVACGFVPVTASTDLLRPGGYGRLPAYLDGLAREMSRLAASTIDEFVVRFAECAGEKARRHAGTQARREQCTQALGGISEPDARARVSPGPLEETRAGASGSEGDAAAVRRTAVANTATVAAIARGDVRYRADKNAKVPKRIDSHLTVFDCVTCDKCLPVCPNAANFKYPTPIVAFDFRDVLVAADGSWRYADELRRFAIDKEMQIACYADFCNECGNCDTFCPEYGGPYIEKPSFFGSKESFERAAPRDGFLVERRDAGDAIIGRFKGRSYELSEADAGEAIEFRDADVTIRFSAADDQIVGVVRLDNSDERCVDLLAYHTMRHLLRGVLDDIRTNQVNASSTLSGDHA